MCPCGIFNSLMAACIIEAILIQYHVTKSCVVSDLTIVWMNGDMIHTDILSSDVQTPYAASDSIVFCKICHMFYTANTNVHVNKSRLISRLQLHVYPHSHPNF